MAKLIKITNIYFIFFVFLTPWAIADTYIGDTAIYSTVSATSPKPNIMFIIDNTQPMQQQGSRDLYDSDHIYEGNGTTMSPAPYDPLSVYQLVAATGGVVNYSKVMDTVEDIDGCTTAYDSLTVNGSFFGPLKANKGDCSSPSNNSFFLGNQLNYIVTPPTGVGSWQASTTFMSGDAVDVGGTIYECVGITGTGLTGASTPIWPTTPGTTVIDNQVTWTMTADLLSMVQSTVKQVADAVSESVKIGLMTFSDNGQGGQLEAPVRDAGQVINRTNLDAFDAAIDALTLIPGNSTQPTNEMLWDAGLYFQGPSDFSDTHKRIGTIEPGDSTYTSPIEESCQKNYVILLTTGSQDDDTTLKSFDIANVVASTGVADPDGIYVDDVAKYLNSPDQTGTQGIGDLFNGLTTNIEGIQTHIIQLLTTKVDRLEAAANVGGGNYFNITNNAELLNAIQESLAEILLETDTAFVAPVVPTSPDNRTFSGQRIYLGFFYPHNDEPWHGNLKKFGINNSGQIIDANGNAATNPDGSFKDVLDANNPAGNTYTATSFWSSGDAGRVSDGGTGAVLLTQIGSRNIYTYFSNSNLTDSSNEFSTTNANLTAALLTVVDDTEKDKLIDFIHGVDSYDEYIGSDRPWVMGDILHSKPNVVNYSQFDFNVASNETNCSINQNTIYVGANDGMLHAFRDCDGEERWAFIPPELLPRLKDIRGNRHPYFVDGSPVSYIYDADRDGNIEAADGDKVILLFGMRRGGDAYYALDVTDPDAPEYLWKIDGSHADFSELGQTWSTPNFGLVKNSSGKVVLAAFVGAGYDNLNEDGRFGNTQGFINTDVSPPTADAGHVTSTATVTPTKDGATPVTNNPKGRGIYAFEVATIGTGGVPTIATSATKVWDFIYGETSNTYNSTRLTHSFPTDITVLDTDYDGFVDRLYAGDTGGQMWRFSQYGAGGDSLRPYSNPAITNWIGKRIFSANEDGDGTKGRKIFYRPSVTLQIGGIINLYFGTGDRAHPLNKNVVDRMYAIFDRHQVTLEEIDADNLIDVTNNLLQEDSTSITDIQALLTSLQAGSLLSGGPVSDNFGWQINLDETGHDGEKVLAPALAFNKVAYYSTYTPGGLSIDPCLPGNLGISRLYAVDYLTGEAVLNFNNPVNNGAGNNDVESTTNNSRAEDDSGNVLRKEDRSIDLGVGIPSGVVVLLPPSGEVKLLIGSGGGIRSVDPVLGGTVYPIYWRSY